LEKPELIVTDGWIKKLRDEGRCEIEGITLVHVPFLLEEEIEALEHQQPLPCLT
jgi:hypothetical protein